MTAQIRPESPPEIPIIIVEKRPDTDILDQYIHTITSRQGDPLIYRMGCNLSTIRRDADGAAYLETLTKDGALAIMATVAHAKKASLRGKAIKFEDVPTPPRIACMLLQSDYPFPPIQTVSRVPIIRTDGSVVTTRGYDAASHIYFDPPEQWTIQPFALDPTQAEAQAAAASIMDLLSDFPFVSDADRANALALGLTLFTRHAIDDIVPMAIIDAVGSRQATGKGLLADVLHIIATGQEAQIATMPRDNSEFRKVITSYANQGQSVIGFDNVRGITVSDVLEAAITAKFWNDRILGGNHILNVRLRCTWFMTGNNVQVGGDMLSRSYYIKIDNGLSHAYERTDAQTHHPERWGSEKLRSYTHQHQARYQAAFMTMIRAWYAAECPMVREHSPIHGRFDQWEDLIGGILAFAGVQGFLGNLRDDIERSNSDDQQWEQFLLAIDKQFTAPFTSQDLNHLRTGHADLCIPDALVEALDTAHNSDTAATRIGKFLTTRAGTRYGDSHIKIVREKADRNGRVLWRIVVEHPEPTPEPEPDPAPVAPATVTVFCPKCRATGPAAITSVETIIGSTYFQCGYCKTSFGSVGGN